MKFSVDDLVMTTKMIFLWEIIERGEEHNNLLISKFQLKNPSNL